MLNKIMLPQKAIFQENKTTNIWKINIKIQMNFFLCTEAFKNRYGS